MQARVGGAVGHAAHLAFRSVAPCVAKGSAGPMYLQYIQQFRAIAILFVVASHTTDPLDWSQSEFMWRAIEVTTSNGTLLFVFIAGFLFQHLLRRYEPKRYLLQKFNYVIVPYLLIAVPAITIVFAAPQWPEKLPDAFGDWPFVAQIAWLYGTGDMLAPLWFIPMISMIYLLAPLLAWADRDARIYWVMPFLVAGSMFLPRDGTAWVGFIIYFPIYLLGMWASHYRTRIIPMCERYAYSLLCVAVGLAVLQLVAFDSHGNMAADSMFESHDDVIAIVRIQKIALTFALLGLLSRYETWIGRRLDLLANVSFSIFFLHYYFVQATWILTDRLWPPIPGNLFTYAVMTAVALFGSIAITLFVQRVAGSTKSRMLVGS